MRSPSGSGNSGRVPPLLSANSIHARTSGESKVSAEVYSLLPDAVVVVAARLRQRDGAPPPTSAAYIMWISVNATPTNFASVWR